ncbi:MAG: nitronate monooxygenase [Solirubrobacteraceae bacterium]|nr:nitronate monooxygenase [Solirubrobacteraceae bacterium]
MATPERFTTIPAVIGAPMAGGPTTPELVTAVSTAGGLGVLAAGYLPAEQLAADIGAVRVLLPPRAPFGVNLFAPPPGPADPVDVAEYATRLAPLADAAGVALGRPRFDDDDFERKLQVVRVLRPPVVTFAFGRPEPGLVDELHGLGVAVWVTITSREEAEHAAEGGADAIIAQGAEAGGHRGGFEDSDEPPLPLDELLADVVPIGTPVIAAGGIMDAGDARRVFRLGATAVQAGTAFLLTPQAGTAAVHRTAIAAPGDTVLTRAFSGRRARGIVNAWTTRIGAEAPRAYPEVHHLTASLRASGRREGNADLVNLWAGTEHVRALPVPAAKVVAELARGLT